MADYGTSGTDRARVLETIPPSPDPALHREAYPSTCTLSLGFLAVATADPALLREAYPSTLEARRLFPDTRPDERASRIARPGIPTPRSGVAQPVHQG